MDLNISNWDFNKGTIDYVDEWLVMRSPWIPVTILAAYFGFVLKVGPQFMEKRKPYKLKNILILYNAVQVVLSLYMSIRFSKFHIKYGVVSGRCDFTNKDAEREYAICHWIYLAAKVSELLDTVFFVLRKKYNQVSFLHLYHHSIMMAFTWIYMKYAPAQYIVFFGTLNSIVHVVMYTYYGIAAMGPQYQKYIWWKKYTTVLQLLQFATFFGVLLKDNTVATCANTQLTYAFSLFNIALFFTLFANFYRKSYKASSAKANKKEPKSLDTSQDNEKQQIYNKSSEDTGNILIQRHNVNSEMYSR